MFATVWVKGKYEHEGEVVRSKREFEEMSKRVTFFK